MRPTDSGTVTFHISVPNPEPVIEAAISSPPS
jgi:hypothetical protein